MIWCAIIVVLLIIRIIAMQALINKKGLLVKELEYNVKTLDKALEIQSNWCEELQSHVDYYKLGMDETNKENLMLKKKLNKTGKCMSVTLMK